MLQIHERRLLRFPVSSGSRVGYMQLPQSGAGAFTSDAIPMAPDCQQNSKNKYMSNNYCLNFRHDFTNEFLTGMIQVTACKFSQKKMNLIGLILSSKIKQLFSLRLQRYISAVCDLEPCGRKISLTGIPLTDFKMVAKLFLRWLLVLYYSSTRRYLLCMHNVFIKQPC